MLPLPMLSVFAPCSRTFFAPENKLALLITDGSWDIASLSLRISSMSTSPSTVILDPPTVVCTPPVIVTPLAPLKDSAVELTGLRRMGFCLVRGMPIVAVVVSVVKLRRR